MTLEGIESWLTAKLAELERAGTLKGAEKVVTAVLAPENNFGPRYVLEGYGERRFLRMNSNSYLALAQHPRVIDAEAQAAERFGTGPGAVRFISGTYRPHVELEKALAAFHGRESALIMSAAYATVMGVLPQLIDEHTLVVSDELNHNCIINAVRLARPGQKAVYAHLDAAQLEQVLVSHKGRVQRVCVVTDGVFSMRGDHAPLDKITAICRRHEASFEQGIVTVVDDSHGVGALGERGRGVEEVTGAQSDVLIATLGKALGVNGGYVVTREKLIAYLRETAPFYVYSNPITPSEAAAAGRALQILDSAAGRELLLRLRRLAARLRAGLDALELETIHGEHPIVPILVRDTDATAALSRHLFDHDVLATGLNYPVVPRGEEEIRLQVCADHTERDIDYLLDVLREFS